MSVGNQARLSEFSRRKQKPNKRTRIMKWEEGQVGVVPNGMGSTL